MSVASSAGVVAGNIGRPFEFELPTPGVPLTGLAVSAPDTLKTTPYHLSDELIVHV
jgi:hypothetical protein